MFIVAAIYHFFDFPQYQEERAPLLEKMKALSIKGSFLIAHEGINGTVSGPRESIDALVAYIQNHLAKGPIDAKESLVEKPPFKRTKVRLKRELISLGPYVSPYRQKTGHYVDAKDWNALISDPDTIVLDTRNEYEVRLGTFEHAINPHTRNFKQLPKFVEKTLADAKNKKIATFCTGGIRCEKFTAWMLEQGYENVYHLKGGILKYLEEIPPEHSKWSGECFVFDQRVAVGHGVTPSSTASMCNGCGSPLTPEDREHPLYIDNTRCGYCNK